MNNQYLWELLNLNEDFNYKNVDLAYKNIKTKNPNIDFAWKVLRDKYYSEIYKKYKNVDMVIRAGFIQDALTLDEVDFYKLNLLTTPFGKILNHLKSKKIERPVVLLSTGGFCPLHDGHIHMMEMARQTLENNGYTVVGGYFSPSHETYVSTKPYYNTNTHKRLELCQNQVENSDWLMVDPWESNHVRTYINFTDVYHRLKLYLNKYINNQIEVAYVCGADNVNFMYSFENQGIGVSINRDGFNQEFENVKKEINSQNVFFINNESNTKYLSSRYIRKNELPITSNKVNDGHYIIRNEGLLPLSHFKNLTTINKLQVAHNQFLKQFLFSLQNIFHHQMKINIVDINEQVENANNKLRDKKTISLDSYYNGTYNLKVSRMFDISDTQKRYISLIGNLGKETIEEQVTKIKSDNYILVDDDSVTGKTLNNIMSFLPNHIQIDDIYLLSSLFENKIFDVVDLRDFIIGAENSGLVVRLPNCEIIRVPYVAPYVSLKSRANISSEKQFSSIIWTLNKEFYTTINENITLLEVDHNFKTLMNFIGFQDNSRMVDICDWHIKMLNN